MNRPRVLHIRDAFVLAKNTPPVNLPTFRMQNFYNVPMGEHRQTFSNLEAAMRYHGGPLTDTSYSCLAGITQILFATNYSQRATPAMVFSADVLELTTSQQVDWFFGAWNINKDLAHLTLEDAIDFLSLQLNR